MGMNVEVTLSTKTCNCGAVYAIPHWVNYCQCPMCAKRMLQDLQSRCDDNWDTIQQLRRSNSALRGALTKTKAR